MTRNTLFQIDDTVVPVELGLLSQLQKKISKCATCLPQYIKIIHGVNQQLLLIAEHFVFLLLVPFQKLGSLIS